MDDSKIIELYMERSEQAISETSKKHGRYCHYIAYSILHNDEDSEECVNDTYLRAWNSIPPKRPSKLQTFLGKITRNLSLNKWEKLSAEKRGAGQTSLILDELSECIPAEQDAVNTVENMVIRDRRTPTAHCRSASPALSAGTYCRQPRFLRRCSRWRLWCHQKTAAPHRRCQY